MQLEEPNVYVYADQHRVVLTCQVMAAFIPLYPLPNIFLENPPLRYKLTEIN